MRNLLYYFLLRAAKLVLNETSYGRQVSIVTDQGVMMSMSEVKAEPTFRAQLVFEKPVASPPCITSHGASSASSLSPLRTCVVMRAPYENHLMGIAHTDSRLWQ